MTTSSELWQRVKDWLWLLLSAAFVAAGIAMLLMSDRHRNEAIVIVALFGTSLVAAVLTVVRRLRSRHGSHAPLVLSGVMELRPLRGRVALLGLLLAVLGGVIVVFGQGFPAPMQVLGGLIGVLGIGLAIAVAIGVLPIGLVAFERSGLRLGRRGFSIVLPWDGIDRVIAGEYYDNPAVFIALVESEQFVAEPPERRNLARKEVRRTMGWVGAHFLITASRYGVSAESLAVTIERYRTDPGARAALP